MDQESRREVLPLEVLPLSGTMILPPLIAALAVLSQILH
jgi:hypothetical protein